MGMNALKTYLKSFFNSYRTIGTITLLFFIVFESCVVATVQSSKKNDMADYLQSVSIDNQLHMDMELYNMSHIATILFNEIINNKHITHLMYEASTTTSKKKQAMIRELLHNLLMPQYEKFKSEGIRQFHFHLPGGYSFLRFHQPEKFGDYLLDVRQSIAFVQEHKMAITIYEEGRIFNGFRNIFPLFFKKTFVGSVEISYSPKILQHNLLAINSSSYLFITNKTIAKQKLFAGEETLHYKKSPFEDFFYDKACLIDTMELSLKQLFRINEIIADDVKEQLQEGKLFSIKFSHPDILQGQRLVVSFIPVKNIDEKTVAYMIHYQFDEFLNIIEKKTQILLEILSVIVMLVSSILFGILLYYRKKQFLLEQKALHDSLTGILNRKGLDTILEHKINKYKRYKHHFSIIFCDIDHFKHINDKYGHEMGDYVLKNFVKIIQQQLRKSDIFGRWGGEEFLIILPQTSQEEAYHVAQKLRKTVANEVFEQVETVHCSAGVTQIYEDDTLSSMMKRVDINLYRAKETGRNKVIADRSFLK